MEFLENISVGTVLHEIGQIMKIPCMVILIILIVIAVWQLGDFFMELFTERRTRQKNVEDLLDRLRSGGKASLNETIRQSALPRAQKRMLEKVAGSGDWSQNERTALAQKYLADEEARFERRTAIPEILAKQGPIYGLLGTLIPLGPGIIALGMGDTETLSEAIGIAFDTTIAGLLAAAVGSLISNIRNRWYDSYLADFEALLEYVLEGVSE